MALNTISVIIDLATTAATVSGFGTQLFVSPHNWFPERVKTYSSLEEATDLPTFSDEYKAVSMHFAQNPALPIKLGRRIGDTLGLEALNVADGEVYTITVSSKLLTSDTFDTYTSTVTASGDTAETIADAIVADISAQASIVDDVTVDNTDDADVTVFTNVNAATNVFYLTDISENFEVSYPSAIPAEVESVASVLNAVDAEDTDYYGITTNSAGQDADILDFASEAEGRGKLFLYCHQDNDALVAWNGTDTPPDVLANLNSLSRRQTVSMWHHQGREIFPEVGVFAFFAGRGYQPGTINWNWKTISGVSAARNGDRVLNSTEIGYLLSRNSNTFEREAVGTIFGPGLVARGNGDRSGEWIEHVTSKDFLIARITEAYKTKFFNLNKISFSSVGINSQKSTLATVMGRYIETETTPNILNIDRPYELTFPQAKDLSFATIASQVLPIGFKAYLSGTQSGVTVQGTLTYNANV